MFSISSVSSVSTTSIASSTSYAEDNDSEKPSLKHPYLARSTRRLYLFKTTASQHSSLLDPQVYTPSSNSAHNGQMPCSSNIKINNQSSTLTDLIKDHGIKSNLKCLHLNHNTVRPYPFKTTVSQLSLNLQTPNFLANFIHQ